MNACFSNIFKINRARESHSIISAPQTVLPKVTRIMLINKQLVGAAALYSLIGTVSGQGVPGKPSLVAPKGAKTLTVAVIGGTANILSSPRWIGRSVDR